MPLHLGGRAQGFLHQWPGTYWEANIKGKTFKLILADNNMSGVYVDGRKIDTEDNPKYEIFQYSGLTDGPHRIRVETQTESPMDAYQGVNQIDVPDVADALPAPPARDRQIELIGDSYAAGYGTTSLKHECTKDEIHDTTDTQQAFGALLGKHYDADYQVNAVSGIGMVRNYDDSPGDVMTALYPYTLFDKQVLYKDPTWNPQVVVIALGDNDFATPVKAGGKWADEDALTADFVATYVKFVEDARKTHPRATFVLMDYGEPQLIPALADIAARLKADGDNRILTWSAGTGFEQTGCDWHLSLNDHKRIAAGLETFIDAQPNIWSQN